MDFQPKVTVIPPAPQFTTHVAIYCRVSTSSQEQMNSLVNQISRLTQFVNRHPNWRLVDIYIDIQSGKNIAARTEFQRMMDDCSQKKIDRIITKSVSRFGRNTVETLDAINKLRSLNIDVYFESEDMHSLEGKNAFMISILEGVAQEESAARSENIKWGMLRGIQNGESKMFNRKCYGYVQDKDGNLVIQEDEAEVVKLIFDLYLSGYSINAIRGELQNKQIKSPTGQDVWSKRTVDTMLKNEKYTGDVLVMKTYSEKFPKSTRKVNKGERDQFIALGTHPAIITKEIFEKVIATREARSNIINGEKGSSRKSTRYSMKKAMEIMDDSITQQPDS
jgi:DNA invertase Pin-like site-specific DNA recombinase